MQSKILPTLLAIDASDSLCTIALQIHGQDIVNTIINNTNQQAAGLLPAIDNILVTNNIKLSDIDAFVVSIGPGRFTGLRIACSCIQGLAYSTDKKVIVINSLELLASQFILDKNINDNKIIWVCQKAYSNVYYSNRLEQAVTKANLISELLLVLNNNLLNNYYFVGNGWSEIFTAADLSNKNIDTYNIYQEVINAKYVFKLANIEFENNNFTNPCDVLPLYCVNPYEPEIKTE